MGLRITYRQGEQQNKMFLSACGRRWGQDLQDGSPLSDRRKQIDHAGRVLVVGCRWNWGTEDKRDESLDSRIVPELIISEDRFVSGI